MAEKNKAYLVPVSYRIRPELRNWLSTEAAQKHDRSANWLVNKLLEEAYDKSKQEAQHATKT